jgi:predicted nucleotidyltransferase
MKKLDSKTIIERIKKERKNLKKNEVKKIGLFGSCAQRKQKSDIDFPVEFKEVNADKFFALLFLLEKMFNKNVDLVDIKNLRPELNHIKKEAKYVKI